jgi:hypothetical protein
MRQAKLDRMSSETYPRRLRFAISTALSLLLVSLSQRCQAQEKPATVRGAAENDIALMQPARTSIEKGLAYLASRQT